jgi:hypothetical protein
MIKRTPVRDQNGQLLGYTTHFKPLHASKEVDPKAQRRAVRKIQTLRERALAVRGEFQDKINRTGNPVEPIPLKPVDWVARLKPDDING